MNSIDKNIFNNYETVETALLNELATETRAKGKKARTLKGEGYYVKYDGVQYDITPEQCRIYKLIRNNYNTFVEQLNSAKSDILGVWKIGFGDRLPVIIAEIERGLEICQKYWDAFKSFITEPEKNETTEEVVNDETEIRILSSADNQSVANGETEIQNCSSADNQSVTNGETKIQICSLADNQSVANGETEVETSETETTKSVDVDVDGLIRELRVNGEISDEDKIIINEDETGIDMDVYKNGRWYTNIVLYEYD